MSRQSIACVQREVEMANNDDPIFAAIEAHRNKAYIAAEQADDDAACEHEGDLAVVMLETVPTTPAGLAALLRYIQTAPGMRERVISERMFFSETFFWTLERTACAAAGLPEPPKPPPLANWTL